jgi:hypothetical protein
MGSEKQQWPSKFQTVEEAMSADGYNSKSRLEFNQYVGDLEDGTATVPQELRGDVVSDNGQCEWDKKKAFVNLHKHKISFEEASKVFEPSLPYGYGILYDDPSDDGTGLNSPWGLDIRDKVLARMPNGACYIIKVDREHVHSGRVRLVSVRPVSEKVVLEAIKAHETNSSVSVIARAVFGDFAERVSPSRKTPEFYVAIRSSLQSYENIRYLSDVTKKAF